MSITATQSTKVEVKIVSIWSKFPEDPKMARNAEYTVQVPREATVVGTLENAFVLTNQDDRPRRTSVCSTSAGDIMIFEGKHYLVEGTGFREVTPEESAKIQELTSRDTSFGYDFMVRHNILKP